MNFLLEIGSEEIPHWMIPALRLSPFAALVDTPFRIWFGELTGIQALAAIGLQLFWAIALAALGWCWLGRTMTVDIEAKAKELAVVQLMTELKNGRDRC